MVMQGALPLIWRNIHQRYNLIGTHCKTCQTDFFPERLICPNCRRKGVLVEKQMPHTGKLLSYTKVLVPPSGFEMQVPYYIALVKLDNNVNVLTQLVDVTDDEVQTGLEVKAVFRKIFEDGHEGVIAYGFKFTPTK